MKSSSKKTYLAVWLRRIRKEMAVSGKLSEMAVVLSRKGDLSAAQWSSRLRDIAAGNEEPDLDLLTKIDQIFSQKGPAISSKRESQADLFES